VTRRLGAAPLHVALCRIIADLLSGGRHSRRTVADITGRSLTTADRWLETIETLPGARRVKIGKTAWIEIPQPEPWKPKKRIASKRLTRGKQGTDWMKKLSREKLAHIEYIENGGKRR
jgi:hypothetical protein